MAAALQQQQQQQQQQQRAGHRALAAQQAIVRARRQRSCSAGRRVATREGRAAGPRKDAQKHTLCASCTGAARASLIAAHAGLLVASSTARPPRAARHKQA